MRQKKSVFRILLELVSWFFLVAFILILGLTFASNSGLLAGYKSFLVQSGSMEPSIMIGDLIIVKRQNFYQKGEVITFNDSSGKITTHRIVAEDKTRDAVFITKGDANRSEDNAKVALADVLGKVILVIPRLGFVIAFGRSLPGLVLLIVIPGTIIVFDELRSLFKKGETTVNKRP